MKDYTEIGGIIVKKPVLASKQPTNSRQLLVKNTITDDEPECNNPCGKHRCTVCKHIKASTYACICHKIVKSGNHSCDSIKVVYLFHYQKMP